MTVYYTENYLNGNYPDAPLIAGVVVQNAVKYTVAATTISHVTPDRLYLMKIPAGVIITNVCIAMDDNGSSSSTLDVGLINADTKVEIDYNGIYAAVPTDGGATFITFYGTTTGTSSLNTDTYVGALGRNYKTTVDSILVLNANTAAIENTVVIEVLVEYFRDYGQDLATTQA